MDNAIDWRHHPAVTCPCGGGSSLDTCCGPYLEGKAPAPTAEALMRSRYTAYTQQAIDYIVDTHHPSRRDQVDRDGASQWSKGATWLGLEIRDTAGGKEADTTGEVEFVARYSMENQEYTHHERSTFEKKDDRWYYVDGDMVKAKPVVRESPKVGRNDPCPCGSGKKFKRCHGTA